MMIFSTGSKMSPVFSSVLNMISGGVTDISKPYLLIFSSNIPRWRSPRPLTVIEVAFPFPVSICKATSFYDSFNNLVFNSFNVNLSPSFPESGEVLTLTEMAIMGGSIFVDGMTHLTFYSDKVWVTPVLANPAIETISPVTAFCI